MPFFRLRLCPAATNNGIRHDLPPHTKQKCPKRGNISTINIYLLVTTPMSAILVQIKLNVKLSFFTEGYSCGNGIDIARFSDRAAGQFIFWKNPIAGQTIVLACKSHRWLQQLQFEQIFFELRNRVYLMCRCQLRAEVPTIPCTYSGFRSFGNRPPIKQKRGPDFRPAPLG